MNVPLRVTLVLEQETDIPRGLAEVDRVQHVGVVVPQVLFYEAVLADFEGIQLDNVQDLLRQVILQKGLGIGKVAPGFSEELVVRRVQVIIHEVQVSWAGLFRKDQVCWREQAAAFTIVCRIVALWFS